LSKSTEATLVRKLNPASQAADGIQERSESGQRSEHRAENQAFQVDCGPGGACAGHLKFPGSTDSATACLTFMMPGNALDHGRLPH
jgi:hypothetical protein